MFQKKIIFIFALMCLLLVSAIPGFCQEKPTCLVLIFYPDEASSEQLESRFITNKYAKLVDRLDIYHVIDREELTTRIADKNYWDIVDNCKNNECAIEAGKLINVDFVIHGIIGHIGSLSSLDTSLINIETGEVINVAGTDYEGTKEDFAEKAPVENIKSLFKVNSIPAPKETVETEIIIEDEEEEVKEKKAFHIGPRLGLVASDSGAEFGGGIEVQYSHLSCQILANDAGFAGGISYYLHPDGNTPFISIAAAHYDDKNHGVDEKGDIFGLLLGYRLNITEKLDTRIGIGAGIAIWDQTEFNRGDTKDSDEEIIPLIELTVGYMF